MSKSKSNSMMTFDPSPIRSRTGRLVHLEVIPPNGQSTYSIRSQTANPNITEASVSLLGFDSSVAEAKGTYCIFN